MFPTTDIDFPLLCNVMASVRFPLHSNKKRQGIERGVCAQVVYHKQTVFVIGYIGTKEEKGSFFEGLIVLYLFSVR